MEKIRVENLSFAYPLGDGEALKNINLSINKSQFVVLCGKSGCGKSTLLRHMKKQMMPYGRRTGCVYVDGKPLEDISDREGASKIGFISQNPEAQIVTDMVWHELAFGLENLGYSGNIIKRRVAEMANYFGIQNWFRKETSQLSGGQKQLLNLASVMVMQPEILILDEPTSQLDPIATTEFINALHRINKELGTTIVISEHRLEEIIPYSDKIVVMEKGKVAAEGKPEEIAFKLKDDQGNRHPMFGGLPAVMRVFDGLGEETVPLTIKDGRILLEKKMEGKEIPAVEGFQREEKATKGEIAFEIKDGFFKYSREGDFVLRGANLRVEKGQWHCILGGNGAGKSTMLKALCGAVKLQRGSVKIGKGLKVSMVPQNPQAVFTEITAREELFEAMSYMDLSVEEKVKKVGEMLALMEIEHLGESNPGDLSGGEQQRLAIGKVLLTEPDIILLDEPTKGLDPFFKISLAKILERLYFQGITILMVSHDIEFCASYGQKASMFFDGEVISTDNAREFFAGNSFYTTAANKLMRNWNKDIVTCEEAETWLKKII
ncbi:MAG: ATP-binding cassette domain-containing protein [Eubacterium sp.]|nr:ATP-binding cassette domain-containing protein [Eubacterium sp.]